MNGWRFVTVAGLLLSVWVAPAQGGALHDTVDPPIGCGKARALSQRFQAPSQREQWCADYQAQVSSGQREALQDTDVLHCNLEIEILPGQVQNIVGSNTITIQSKSAALTQFTFRLRDQYIIDSVVINGATGLALSAPSADTHVAALDRAYGLDEIFALTINYRGTAVSPAPWDPIEFVTHNGQDIVYTLSEPFMAYTWWPTKEDGFAGPGDNSEKFTMDLAVIAPDTMMSASLGLLQGVDALSGSRSRYRWSSQYPIPPYLAFFSSTNYDSWSVNYTPLAGGSMPVLFYIYPESNTAGNRAAWEKSVDMLVTFRDLFGEYPFVDEKYGIYQFVFGGGMEHQTFTGQGGFGESLTAHELAHQWWGDLVTCKTWHDIWLNEGLATYSEALWAEFKPGSSGLPALKSSMASKRYTGPGTVYVSAGELSSLWNIFDWGTTYTKAAWVMHMLRHLLGDTGFWDMLAAYRAQYAFSGLDTNEFQTICEQFYPGGDLSWFFQEWVFGERIPAYSWGWNSVTVAGQDYLLLHIDQTQSASYQRFDMPLDVVVDGATYVVFNDADPQHFVIPLPASPASVALDPDAWVLWSTRTQGAYLPGPPKVVTTSPSPGQIVLTAAGTSQISTTFHTDVNTLPGDYTLTGAQTGPVALPGFAYDGLNRLATLTAAVVLPADDYTLTVNDTITAVDSGQTLDGEVGDSLDPASLPSGNGVAGGPAVVSFSVICDWGDSDCDGDVDLKDFARFQSCHTGTGGGPPANGCAMMRLDAGTEVDLNDFRQFIALMQGP
ncbi:MAG: M1 family metallopeptidase [Phycisphaerae bacterium]